MKTIMRVIVVLCVLLLAVVPVSGETRARPAAVGEATTELISVAADGSLANDFSWKPSISADGRYVAFHSYASNLVPDDTNFSYDVFVRDRVAGTTQLVSVASNGSQLDGMSTSPSISADGRFVAFAFAPAIPPPGITRPNTPLDYGWFKIMVHDRQLMTQEIISVSIDGYAVNSHCVSPSISADGQYVAFQSAASNLVDGDTNGWGDIFIRDRVAETTERVSVNSSESQSNEVSFSPSISSDGRYVAFMSYASNLVDGDTNGWGDVFVRDRVAGTTELISVASDGAQGNHESHYPSISSDGRYVVFSSVANNLVDGDTNTKEDIFIHDRVSGITGLISVSSERSLANGNSYYPAISADGAHVAFWSFATNLAGDNCYSAVFVRDRVTGTTEHVSLSRDGSVVCGHTGEPPDGPVAISTDGRYVAFLWSTRLVLEDTNDDIDVYLRDRGEQPLLMNVFLPVVIR